MGLHTGSALVIVKRAGKVGNCEAACASLLPPAAAGATLGLAHTRWATHGAPTDANAHPHASGDGSVVVVHNGIIENAAALRTALEAEGCVFASETDTEVFAHLVASVRRAHADWSLEAVVRAALAPVHGAFGLVFAFADEPDVLIAARRGSPLIIGVGEHELFVASDASAVVEHTKQVEYLQENELVRLTRGGSYVVSSLLDGGGGGAAASGAAAERPHALVQLEMTLDAIEKGGYKHFMLKEIMEQPAALTNAMRGRVDAAAGSVRLGGLAGEPLRRLAAARRIIIAACGTSYHSALVGEYILEALARVPVEVEYASEFRYRDAPLFPAEDVLIVLSQSGETADTLAAVREAKARGVLTIGLVNTVGSSIARETDAGAYLHVGPEIGVASTKAFTGQVLLLAMLGLALAAEKRAQPAEALRAGAAALAALPAQLTAVLSQAAAVADMARSFRFAQSFLFLGRGFNMPVALEGALKLKEISYIHAEGYAAAEMKHGPIALIDRFMPVVIIALPSDPNYEKVKSNIEEVLARGGLVIAITEEGNAELDGKCEAVLRIPRTLDYLSPLLAVVPLQLLAYYIADLRKCNVDQPRNLAKSVTVE